MTKNLKINDDLKKYLKSKKILIDGVRYEFEFGNGLGASIIKRLGSYGFVEDLWELAVLENGHLQYYPLTDWDVVGYLTDNQVNTILYKIKDDEMEEYFEEENKNDKS